MFGCVLAAVGFYLWAGDVTSLSFSAQQWDIILAGAGIGFMLGPASTDAVNRACRLSYGEATGITQTVRNYAASLGIAVLGTVLVTVLRSQLTTSLTAQGLPSAQAHAKAATLSQLTGGGGGQGGSGGRAGSKTAASGSIPHFFRLDFAHATQTVLYIMAAVMAVAAIVGFVGLQRGVQQDQPAVSEAQEATAP